jgi:hypothetical protein
VVKYQAHINVERVNHDGMHKYLFKYVTKGFDCARVGFYKSSSSSETAGETVNEINNYLECRCVTPHDASWRLLQFDIHHTLPSVERLPVHLPLENNVMYAEDDNLEEVISNPNNLKTKLTAWLEANGRFPAAREHTYIEFPAHFTWHSDKNEKYWDTRKGSQKKIGRVANVSPAQGELYYLRLLLHIVKGAKSYAEIRTIGNREYPTFRAACEALGLLGDDQEWSHALADAAQWATPSQLRHLFVTLLLFCEVTNPKKLFDEHATSMSQDRTYRLNRNSLQGSNSSADIAVSFVLFEVDKLLRDAGYSLSHFNLPLPDDIASASLENRLLLDELSYDIPQMTRSLSEDIPRLNKCQEKVYDAICNSVQNREGRTFFVYGFGGTGKTFLWTTILNSVRSKGKVALAVASSGIASLLLPGGRTPHSRFKIPLDIRENSMCNVKKNTNLAELIQKTSLIIWDEAPVNHRYCFEALNRTLRDMMSDTRPSLEGKQFGNITVVLSGDFRQTLPVIPNGRKQQILKACIVNSYLWRHCVVLKLTENMRLRSQFLSPSDKQDLRIFAEWLLRVGDGTEPFIPIENEPENIFIKIPPSLLLPSECRNLQGLISFVYNSDSPQQSDIASYFCDRAILAPTNEVVSEINRKMIAELPTNEMLYYSADSIDDTSSNLSTLEALYPTEFLNTIPMNGLPDHVLHLKIGVPIMLLRNLDPSRGLCNGTRLIVSLLHNLQTG